MIIVNISIQIQKHFLVSEKSVIKSKVSIIYKKEGISVMIDYKIHKICLKVGSCNYYGKV